jgi:hypothetical protein
MRTESQLKVPTFQNKVEMLLSEIGDARELLDALAWLKRGATFNARFLYQFSVLHARDQLDWLASERDSLIEIMATLATCSPAMLRFDIERIVAERHSAEEIVLVEEITEMRDADET